MMVTFISQCEKKALTRTRKVLDAFAERIGTNTWQTVITQEGLLAVKKSLRQTASRNTAVSCHWIRSRSRSELVWIVGNKNKFNAQGRVAVNVTQKEVFMDIMTNKPQKGVCYANTHLQRLDQHLFAVGLVAKQLYSHFYKDRNNQANAAFVAGCFHDIGKLDPCFQDWVVNPKSRSYEAEDGQHIDSAKFSFENHPRHNEISTLIFQCLSDQVKGISAIKNEIKHAIYWHHAKPFRTKAKDSHVDEFGTYGKIYSKLKKSVGDKALALVSSESIAFIQFVSDMDKRYHTEELSFLDKVFSVNFDDEVLANYKDTPLPSYKDYDPEPDDFIDYRKQIRKNATNNEIRACVITADRWVSALSAQDLDSHIKEKSLSRFTSEKINENIFIESGLVSSINECLSRFPDDERGRQQSLVARNLADDIDHPKVLAGAAGCGKTKIALEWASLVGAQQILWVCPRVQICQGIFAELKASDNPYLQDATVEILTGELKFTNSFSNPTPEGEEFTADIVVTTIDQLLNTVISHSKADRLLNYLNAHIVFDEYHEYINIPSFNLLFAELVTSRFNLEKGCNLLLVSATPHYFYLDKLLDIDTDYDLVEMSSFNKNPYQFNFCTYDEEIEDDSNPFYKQYDQSTFVISNTALVAQKGFLSNMQSENSILFHSKFKKSDKKALFKEVFESFSRDGNSLYDVLRSGPIVQASLNISCRYMISDVTTPENCLQRMGRLDRFGLSKEVNQYTIAIPKSLVSGKGQGAIARFLSSNNELESTKAWYEFLLEKTNSGENLKTIADVYQIYKDFYHTDYTIRSISSDLLKAIKKSVISLTNKVSEPKVIIKKKNKTRRVKISARSLRGDNRFVQMAICNLDNVNRPNILEEYAYTIPISESDDIDSLTASCNLIEGYGDSENNLLAHMKKKHHNITGEPKAYKDFILLNNARDPEFPVYLSYTPNDLLAVGGERERHPSSIYYGVCEKQAVGAISIKQLTSNEE